MMGSVDYKKLCDHFDGSEKVICNPLISWVNAGSHSALDDAYITPSDATVRNALRVFKEIFVKSDHQGHYEMMNPPLLLLQWKQLESGTGASSALPARGIPPRTACISISLLVRIADELEIAHNFSLAEEGSFIEALFWEPPFQAVLEPYL